QLPAAPPAATVPPAAVAAPASPNGLRRRVPGSHLSAEPTDRPALAAQLTDTDADAARLLVEQLESGVARALHDTTIPHRQ
ncbi:hypothetical protein, partial [Actinoplanes philippinensis]|uniref:hypothetical protein n=1 Tax=Actinoplanes philippinensis TaxID=35752 RepID=UPI0033F34F20